MALTPNLFSRKCLDCGFERIPEIRHVKEGKAKFVIFKCPMCKHSDIERWADRPRPKVWDGKSFLDPDFEIGENRDEG